MTTLKFSEARGLYVEARADYNECRGPCSISCTHTLVYFIQEGDEGPIKIGHGTRVLARLSGLQSANWRELRLIGTMRGGRAEELRLHAKFAQLHLRGEWFEPGDALLNFIEEVAR